MRIAGIAIALGLLVGCVQNTTIGVNLIVPVEVMDAVPVGDYPLQVGFGTDMHAGGSWAICAPSDEPFGVLIEDTASGCVQAPLEVHALMGPFTPPSTGCVDERGNSFNAISGGTILAEGFATAFTDANEATCITREESIDVTVELVSGT